MQAVHMGITKNTGRQAGNSCGHNQNIGRQAIHVGITKTQIGR